MTTFIIIIILIVYIVPGVLSYRKVQKAHSKGGRWSRVEPDFMDFALVVLPVCNITLYLLFLGEESKDSQRNFYTKFFRIKKD